MGIEARTNEALYCQAISPVLQKANKQKTLYLEARYHKLLGQAWFYHLPASDSKVPGGSEGCSPSGYLPVQLWKFSPGFLIRPLLLTSTVGEGSIISRDIYIYISLCKCPDLQGGAWGMWWREPTWGPLWPSIGIEPKSPDPEPHSQTKSVD